MLEFNAQSVQHYRNGYNLALAIAGFGKVVKTKSGAYVGKPDKIEGHRFGKFHLKVYKKRWFTKAIDVVPLFVAQAMLGRSQYLDEYYNQPLEKRQEYARKILKAVSIYQSKADKKEVVKQMAQIMGVQESDLDDAKIAAIQAIMGKMVSL